MGVDAQGTGSVAADNPALVRVMQQEHEDEDAMTPTTRAELAAVEHALALGDATHRFGLQVAETAANDSQDVDSSEILLSSARQAQAVTQAAPAHEQPSSQDGHQDGGHTQGPEHGGNGSIAEDGDADDS